MWVLSWGRTWSGLLQGNSAAETGGACGASFPGLAEQCMSQCRPRKEHSGGPRLDPQDGVVDKTSAAPAWPSPSGALRPNWAKAAKSQWVPRPCSHTYSDRARAAS